ncbi:MAG: glycoside hydrolase family 3 C-terminal domain-containing protein [Erythrobacter sp.]|uniref:glycoside hydrolase family 3 C-terminal domain-containing protein n=1 Tax=Erythrobacter sp. TaxID=1042 RepID=UPI001B0A325C|nr:glycoside hydrolase family 3 C-terminal domain-containing protein [Erythrobacter sp.]MBO6766842.1 glycoside hydrolase family 3 C-terminal domain-containing protein [Erythrobacter sp.]
MPGRPTDYAAQRKRFVEDLLDILSLEERAGQLVLLRLAEDDDSSEIEHARDRLRAGQLGGLICKGAPRLVAELQRLATEETRSGIPLFVVDEPGRGEAVVMPAPFALANSWDADVVERCTGALASEAIGNGTNWLLAPDVSLCVSTSTEDLSDSWGASGVLARRLASATVRGLQSGSAGAAGILACLRTDDPSWVRRRDIHRPGEKLRLVAGVLRESLPGSVALGPLIGHTPDIGEIDAAAEVSIGGVGGFEGIDLAEWAEIARATNQSLSAVPYAGISVATVVAAVHEGRLSVHRLNDIVRKIIGAKYDLGLFRTASENGRKSDGEAAGSARAIAQDAARHAIVLLRNDPALLPLSVDSGKILVIGQAAKDRSLPTGDSSREGASLIDGLDALGLDYQYVPGLALRQEDLRADAGALIDADRMAIGMANEAARRAQTIIVALGEGAALSEAQRTMLETVRAANRNVVLVTLGSHPLDPDISGRKLACVLHAGQLGSMSGHAIAEVLTGECAPRGRLAAPMIEKGRDGLSFGHGLGYCECGLTDTAFELGHARIAVTAVLHNLGNREATETVQLYLRRPTDPDQGTRELADFQRVSLVAGDSRRLLFDVTGIQLGRFEQNGDFAVPPGTYEISLGLSEARAQSAEILISADMAAAMTKARAADPHPALFARLSNAG